LLPLAVLASCGILPWRVKSEDASPDGRVRATVEYKGSAACCSDHSRLILANGPGGSLIDPGEAVTAANADARTPIWFGNDLVVAQMCGATSVEARSRMLRDPLILSDGRMNFVRVEVVTAPNTRWGDHVLCARPADVVGP
jgi:hypothetical protein